MHPARIIVISDTHGRLQTLHDIVRLRMDEAELFIHLGDGEREMDEIRGLYPGLPVCQVRGNCDFASQLPLVDRVAVRGKTILFTHGHQQMVKYGLAQLKELGRKQHADILLYGHTHQSYTEYENAMYLMNPGSPTMPRNSRAGYGMIDITDSGIILIPVTL